MHFSSTLAVLPDLKVLQDVAVSALPCLCRQGGAAKCQKLNVMSVTVRILPIMSRHRINTTAERKDYEALILMGELEDEDLLYFNFTCVSSGIAASCA